MKTNIYITAFTGFALILLASMFILMQVYQSRVDSISGETESIDSTFEEYGEFEEPEYVESEQLDPVDGGAGVGYDNPGISEEMPAPTEPVACTEEAKICPDGTSVGRTGPNCEFTACPTSPALEQPVPEEEMTACTMDAMMCPDGSYVGRTGPNCQFVCPTLNTPTDLESN